MAGNHLIGCDANMVSKKIRFQNNPFLFWVYYRLGFAAALTQTSPREQDCLTRYAADRMCAVEIGVWHGVNTRRFRNVMHADGTLYAVDPFPLGRFGVSWQRRIAHREATTVEKGKIVWLEEYSNTAVDSFKSLGSRQIDFMFIDGDHSYEGVRTDWELWSPLVAPGGVVALHDSRSYEDHEIDHVGAARYTAEVIRKDPRFEVIDEVDSVTVVRRRCEV